MRKSAQNNSSSDGPDAALEGTLHGGREVHLRVHFKEPLKMRKKVTKRTYLKLHFMVYLKVHLLV